MLGSGQNPVIAKIVIAAVMFIIVIIVIIVIIIIVVIIVIIIIIVLIALFFSRTQNVFIENNEIQNLDLLTNLNVPDVECCVLGGGSTTKEYVYDTVKDKLDQKIPKICFFLLKICC